MPTSISVVIQIETFEAWLIAHTEKLIELGYLKHGVNQVLDCDGIANPQDWLERNKGSLTYRKSPPLQKKIVSQLDPNVMRRHSRSFDKLCRETAVLAHEN